MIPSDHFTRFYNEVFKFLEKQGEEDLQAYWLEISKNQEKHTLELFREKGLQGMYEYWDHIRIEENCDLDLKLEEDNLELKMNVCPSLSKVLDNDAEPMKRYCDHCAAWIGPGILETPLTKDGLEKGNNKQVLKSQIPLGRIGLPKDIGGAAVFLSSEEAEYITGQMLYIDGGILANQMNWDETLL